MRFFVALLIIVTLGITQSGAVFSAHTSHENGHMSTPLLCLEQCLAAMPDTPAVTTMTMGLLFVLVILGFVSLPVIHPRRFRFWIDTGPPFALRTITPVFLRE